MTSTVGCSSPLSPTPLAPPEPGDVIGALFLGGGPLAAGDCAITGVWTSYAPRSTVTLLIASTIDEAGRATLERAVADVQRTIANRFRFEVQPSSKADPIPGPQQIRS